MSIKNKDDSQNTVKEVVDNFKSLLEKVQGISFNYENHNWFFPNPLVTSMAHVRMNANILSVNTRCQSCLSDLEKVLDKLKSCCIE